MSDADNDFEAYDEVAQTPAEPADADGDTHTGAQIQYAGVRTTGFKDMLLKPELLKAISDAAFEHPSEVQHACIHPAMIGQDILCQAKAGMGKTAVFVLPTLHNLQPATDGKPRIIVMAHAREMTLQISREFERFAKYLDFTQGSIARVYGGVPRAQDVAALERSKPLIIVGTPGRLADLCNTTERGEPPAIDLSAVESFIIDEADRILGESKTLKDAISIFTKMPKTKQTMLLSATMPEEIRATARRMLRSEQLFEKYVDADTKLTLHGLNQYYLKVDEKTKISALFKLLDENSGYNQVIVFVNKTERAVKLGDLMRKSAYPTYTITGSMPVEKRLAVYEAFKKNEQRFLVATDLFGRGVDVQSVNLVINFDCPLDRFEQNAVGGGAKKCFSGSDQYLHRIGRAGRFGTRGTAVTFLSSADDVTLLNEVRTRFSVTVKEVAVDGLAGLTADLAAAADE